MYYFTADEHYGHANIIRFCRRPFGTAEEMDAELIRRHNEVVADEDIVIHAGDFAFRNKSKTQSYVADLRGMHVFLRGSHDHWLDERARDIWQQTIEGQHVVVCHYAMRVWPRSHYNSWQLYGHSHGMLEPIGKQWDIGVDSNNFYPVSFEQIREIMRDRPDNQNFIKRGKQTDTGDASQRAVSCEPVVRGAEGHQESTGGALKRGLEEDDPKTGVWEEGRREVRAYPDWQDGR